MVVVGEGAIYRVVEKRVVSGGVYFGLALANEPDGEVRYKRAEHFRPDSVGDFQKAMNKAFGSSSKAEPPSRGRDPQPRDRASVTAWEGRPWYLDLLPLVFEPAVEGEKGIARTRLKPGMS